MHLHSTLPLGGSGRRIANTFGRKKAIMMWLPDSEKIEDVITRFDSIHERDRQTDGHMDTA